MNNFFSFEIKNLHELYSKESDDLNIPLETLEAANINLAKNASFYLR